MISGYFGLPGCGKSTIMAKIAVKELRRIKRGCSKYDYVFTNFYVKGCYKFDFSDLQCYNFENALVLLDEITIDADNRDFKNFPRATLEWFILHRHYNCDVIYFTQQWDAVDKKIRNLTYNLYYAKKIFCFTFCRQIFRTIDINELTREIITGYRFPNLLELFFGKALKFTFRPLYYKFFNSFDKPLNRPLFSAIPWDND